MIIRTIPVGPIDANCHLLSEPGGVTLIIDPGADADAIEKLIRRLGLQPAAFLLTHGHMDHLSALADLADRFPVPVLMHARDLEWAFSPANAMPPFYPSPRRPGSPVETIVDGQAFAFGGLAFKVLHTPGHTPGGVCFHFEQDAVLVTGDTLFQGSVGRTDLEGGDGRLLTESLRALAALPPATRVLAGHGDETTIGEECRNNPFLKGLVSSGPQRRAR